MTAVKKGAATAATLALAALFASCGTRESSTQLQIRLHDGSGGARTYELRCDPDRGTVPNPARACRALATKHGLLADGIGFDHSCPGGAWIEVVGQRHNRRVSVVFPQCAWVPAQGYSAQRWTMLLGYKLGGRQRYGRPSSDAPLQSAADLRRREALQASLHRRQDALRKHLSVEARKRQAALANGRPVTELNRITLRMLRELTELATTVGGYPHPTDARLFVSTWRKAVRVLNGDLIVTDGNRLVFAIVVGVGPSALTLFYDAKTLQGIGGGFSLRRPATTALGRGRQLFSGFKPRQLGAI